MRQPQSLPARIAEHVRGLIAAGALGPGDRLPGERELAELLAVSRSSVREAVQSLAALGFVSVRHGHGVFIVPPAHLGNQAAGPEVPSQQQAQEYYAMREALEVPAARWAASEITPQSAAQLDEALAQLEHAEQTGCTEPRELWRLHTAFHVGIALAARNRILSQILQAHHQTASPGGASAAGHAAIVQAITMGDEPRAGQAARAHVRAAQAAHAHIFGPGFHD
ncbi:MAG TPA: GntR family transcriptional regulator [Streptosporangiaceae bacterium]|jgi:GntR family transcriptional repressor for pyruvate dehydrogenase complex